MHARRHIADRGVKASWRQLLLALGLAMAAQPAAASDQAIFGTMAACRAANVDLGTTMARLDQLGWTQVTNRADRSKIAAHMSAGVHHTARGFDRSDYREMHSLLTKNAGQSTRKIVHATSHLTVVYYTLGGSMAHQLILWDDAKVKPNGQPLVHSRTCYIATPSHPSVKAFAAFADPVPHLGIRRMKGQWVNPKTRRYWVRASYREFPTSGLPFRPATTDFIRIDASNTGNN